MAAPLSSQFKITLLWFSNHKS